MKNLFKYIMYAAITLAFVLLPWLAMAQTTPSGSTVPAAETPGLMVVLIPVLVPIIISILKFFVPKIPKSVLPIIAPILGAVIEIFTSGTLGVGTAWGAALGSAGVGLREIVDQMKKGSVSAK